MCWLRNIMIFCFFSTNQKRVLFLLIAILIAITYADNKEDVPIEWRDEFDNGFLLFSKDLYRSARSHQSSFPLLVPSIGNGYVATVVGSETVYVGGLFNGRNFNGIDLTPVSHRARIPAYLNLNVTNAHVDVVNSNGDIFLGGFGINTRHGVFQERFFVGDDVDSIVQVEQKRYAVREMSAILAHEIYLDNTISTNPKQVTLNITVSDGGESQDITFTEEKLDRYTIYRGHINTPELANSLQVEVGVVVSNIPNTITIEPGEKKKIVFHMAIRTNIPGDKLMKEDEQPWKAALREYQLFEQKDDKMDPNGKPWNKIWRHGRIEVGGNLELQRIIQSSLYWILMSTRSDWPWSLSPGSLASNAYNGHSFWDCETWMYPPLLTFYPDIAASLIQYRFNHLEASKAKARGYNHCRDDAIMIYDCIIWPPDVGLWKSFSPSYQQKFKNIVHQLRFNMINETDTLPVEFENAFTSYKGYDNRSGDCNYKGALFAWEAGFTGTEVCPCMAGGTCLHEHHISGDIAFAVYQYWQATHDLKWLKDIGFPLAFEIAEFWESRVTYDGYEYHILNVIPPDESAMGVNDSVFTNVIAKYSLRIATEFGEILNINTPKHWLEIADNIVIPFSETEQRHIEYDGYEDKVIKQADVVLLGYPLQYPMDAKIRENDLDFYSERTHSRGPAMTWSVTAIGYLEVLSTRLIEDTCGVRELTEEEEDTLRMKASDYFFHSYQNAQPPYYIWTETPIGGAYNFITGAGGFLQGVIAGYGGIRLKSDGLHIKYPLLPDDTEYLNLRHINFMKNEFDLLIGYNEFTIILERSYSELIIEELNICTEEVIKTHEFSEDIPFKFPNEVHLRIKSKSDEHSTNSNTIWKETKKYNLKFFIEFGFGSLIGCMIILFLLEIRS